jgi:hypothetical protein
VGSGYNFVWGTEAAKLNRNFEELYRRVKILEEAIWGVNPIYDGESLLYDGDVQLLDGDEFRIIDLENFPWDSVGLVDGTLWVTDGTSQLMDGGL